MRKLFLSLAVAILLIAAVFGVRAVASHSGRQAGAGF
jgi:hypothetical protein